MIGDSRSLQNKSINWLLRPHHAKIFNPCHTIPDLISTCLQQHSEDINATSICPRNVVSLRYPEPRRTLGTRFPHGSRPSTTNLMRQDPHPYHGFPFGGDQRILLPMLRTILPLWLQPSPDPIPLGRWASSSFNYFFLIENNLTRR